jgi:3'-phosphoadenosine 5'-phosphosulfate (PAPS) 3'-phosphatase
LQNSECLISGQKLGVKAPPVRIDSQAKYGALSRGDGVIYLRFPHKGYREKIWDHAAGYIVVAGIENIHLPLFFKVTRTKVRFKDRSSHNL